MSQDYKTRVNNLPEKVRTILMSNLPAEECYKASTSYGLNEEEQNKLAKLVGLLFVKDVSLERLTDVIQKNFGLSDSISAGLALTIIKNIFLPLGEFFPNAKSIIQTLSQKAAKPTQEQKSLGLPSEPVEIGNQPRPSLGKPSDNDTVIEKDLATAITEKEAIANQDITSRPIKLPDSDMAKLPNIRNWITDYRHFLANSPGQEIPLVRTKYLYDSPNGKSLSEKERMIVGAMLKSYDEYTRLPFSQETGRLMTEKIEAGTIQEPPQVQAPQNTPPQPSISPRPIPTLIQTPPAANQNSNSTYREKVSDEDMSGPQMPKKPEPRLDGNIINLKDM